MGAKLCTRFAPTPNGYLHLGNFYHLIWVTLHARRRGAEVGLRLDDYDQSRYRPHFADEIFRVLEKLGFAWTRGPTSTSQFEREFSSRHRQDLYRATEQRLAGSSQVYWCTCTRRMEVGKIYSGRCRDLQHPATAVNENGLAAQLRFAVPSVALQTSIGDFIVVPRRGEVSYHLASIVDDVHFGYNFLVRGEDLAPSSAAQLALAPHLGLKKFSEQTQIVHHGLVRSDSGEKLSKSQLASPVLGILNSPGGLHALLKNFATEYLEAKDENNVPDNLHAFVEKYAGARCIMSS